MTWTTLPAGTSASIGVQESDELLMAMALHVAADDRAVEHVQRGEEGRGAVALVVMGHRAEPALLQRQSRLGAVEGLDLALLVDRQHDGVRRRVDVEPDHVTQLVDEVRVVRELELPATVRLQSVRSPDAPDRAGADADRLRHHVGRPMGRLAGWIGKRQRHHALGHRVAERGDARGPRLVAQEALEALLHEPLLPAPDAGLRLACPAHDLVGAHAVGAQEHDGGSPGVLLSGVAIPGDRLKAAPVRWRQRDGDPGAHARDSHAHRSGGIPPRTLPSDGNH